MKTTTRSLSLVLILTAMGSVSMAEELPLKGRSAIEISLGSFFGVAKASNRVGTTGIQMGTLSNGFAPGLGYSYWLKEHLSLTVTASLLSAKATITAGVSKVTLQASNVILLLFGLRFYVPEPEARENVRPFLSAAVGTYFGSEATNALLSQQTHVETAVGGRLGAGIDFFVGDHFKLGATVGYHLMSDFGNAVGGRKNYNGGEFSLGTGYIL
jgi:outer membrane protein W